VRELYQRLSAEGWIAPWLDEEKLLQPVLAVLAQRRQARIDV